MQYLHAPGRDLPGEGEGGAVGVGEVDILQLHHHLTHHVVPAVPVKAQHNKVQRQDLEKKSHLAWGLYICRKKKVWVEGGVQYLTFKFFIPHPIYRFGGT